jgi:hypothetical protein
MKLVYISVEGQTEETFVREVLAPHLVQLTLKPMLLKTNEANSSKKEKGGIPKYSQVKKQLQSLLRDTRAFAVTTMYDLYALPKDFPGITTKPNTNGYDKVKHLEQFFKADINQNHFHPYLQLHEFETLLFVSPQIMAEKLNLTKTEAKKLASICSNFNSPEDINESATTCPSARILSIKKDYQKVFDGSRITKYIGLEAIRQSCPHFNEWLTWLESLGEK